MFGSPSMKLSAGLTQLPLAFCRFARAAASSARQSCVLPVGYRRTVGLPSRAIALANVW